MKTIITNGCFDLFHAGHLSFLERCRFLGDRLIVGVDSDKNVLKQKRRCVTPENERLAVISALKCVDYACLFEGPAYGFFVPFISSGVDESFYYLKGSDRSLATMDQDDRFFLEQKGVKIIFIPRIERHSTSALISKIIKEGVDLSGS